MFFKKKYSIKNIRKYTVGIDKKVLLHNNKRVNYINFDNAASTPTLVPVLDKMNEFLEWYSNIHRGTGYKSKISTIAYEEAHDIVADFVGSDKNKNTVIFVKNTTEAINKLSYRFPLNKDDIVITTIMEHHSNDLPWRRKAKLLHTNICQDGRLDLEDLENKLKKYKGKVKLVTVTGASNVTGYINNIHYIASLAHRYGAKIMVDGAQLVPHRKVNMSGYKDDDYIDFLVFSAHKMYAPFGTGVLIGPKKFFQRGDPEYVGGGTIISVTQYNSYWADLPDKDEAGTPNIVGGIALAKVIKILNEIGMDNIKKHEKKLTEHIIKKLKEIPSVNIYSSINENIEDMVGVISFNVNGIPHNLLASVLAYEGGIGVRNGCFCAHPYIHKLLNLSSREISRLQKDLIMGNTKNIPGLVRVSFGMYNTIEEVNKFIKVLNLLVSNKKNMLKKYKYNKITGEYEPSKLPKKMFSEFSI
ncbi:aminotransferase class V-fold PLP-dependent enzyme [Thermohalobacter berrensis]|uniref:Class V aminotransferase n=1 Tax=Thermohalobacter berrensis TaxID=99594 RepID=A0A419SV20_9FIRM|nr:aminotransferase class V-fold PLP-dependent enzyme [Thermohalobacter berrensis]RKD29066.1 class V aminotransferase [Thermohalobacter berrensis]